MRHLISTGKRLVGCGECGARIWFCFDGGMPVYADLESVDPWCEIRARLEGCMTFVECGPYLVCRNQFNASSKQPAHVAHPHRAGFVEWKESPCRIETKKKATDFSVPPF